MFPPENDEGCIEYKVTLLELSKIKILKYATQMKWRLQEGNGNCIYILGIKDNGTIQGISDNNIDYKINNLKLIIDNIQVILKKCTIFNIEKDKNIIIVHIQNNFNLNNNAEFLI